MTVSFVPVEYEVEGQRFSSVFFIYKNADGSIVWLTDEPSLQVQSLSELHRWRRLMSDAQRDLPASGIIEFLAQEAMFIAKHLRDILQENETLAPSMDLSKPMKTEIIFLESEDVVLPWQRSRLLLFARRYQWLVDRCDARGLPSPPAIPNEMAAEPFLNALDTSAETLLKRALDIARRYG
jgi:hypothetical protein